MSGNVVKLSIFGYSMME